MTFRQFVYRYIYLRSIGWMLTRRLRKRGFCSECGTKYPPLHLHHDDYSGYRMLGLFAFILPDMVSRMRTLCARCHRKAHGR